jgi:hypothetical protein
MKNDQLFKRLLKIALDELAGFIPFEEDIGKALYKLDLAARTRQILHCVQLEDMWQELDEETELFNVFLSMRLSPDCLCSCLDFKEDMNNLEWWLVFPKIKDLPEDQQPSCFGEFLGKLERVDIVDINDFDIGLVCEYLDQAYDFTVQKYPPPSFN